MFGKKKAPVPPAMDAPELDSSAEYVNRYNEAWEAFYVAQEAYEIKTLETSRL